MIEFGVTPMKAAARRKESKTELNQKGSPGRVGAESMIECLPVDIVKGPCRPVEPGRVVLFEGRKRKSLTDGAGKIPGDRNALEPELDPARLVEGNSWSGRADQLHAMCT